MAYYDRLPQLLLTLDSIEEKVIKPDEVIIVDDASVPPLLLEDKYSFKIIVKNILPEERTWVNPGAVYNIAYSMAIGDKIIIQNPECFHRDDIVEYVKDHLVDGDYMAFGCYSTGPGEDPRNPALNPRPLTHEGDSAWYNHSAFRPAALNFTAAITRNSIARLGGLFNPMLFNGIAYDDTEFVWRVKNRGLNIKFVDDYISIHQYHYHKPSAAARVPAGSNAYLYEGIINGTISDNMQTQVNNIVTRSISPYEIVQVANQYNSVLEIGCGEGQFIGACTAAKKIGIEGCQELVDRCASINAANNVEVLCMNIVDLPAVLQPKSIECVIALDIIEHFEMCDALAVLEMCEMIATKAVLCFIPVGNHPQKGDPRGVENSLNDHLSTWYCEDMKALGYQVYFDPTFHNEPGKDRGAMLAYKFL
jgi:SAM-dependent methyltransferase